MSAAVKVVPTPPVDDEPVAPEALDLDVDEASIVAAEAAAAAQVLPEPLRSQAHALAEAATSGTVPADLVDTLEYVAITSLTGGRARRRYTAEGEKHLDRVLARTPGGRARADALREVNTAIGALSGRSLQGVRVATRVPGSHTVTIDTDGITLTLGLSAAGVTVESVAL